MMNKIIIVVVLFLVWKYVISPKVKTTSQKTQSSNQKQSSKFETQAS